MCAEYMVRLCHRTDTNILEARKLSHLMRSVKEQLFVGLVCNPLTTADEFIKDVTAIERALQQRYHQSDHLATGAAAGAAAPTANDECYLHHLIRQTMCKEIAKEKTRYTLQSQAPPQQESMVAPVAEVVCHELRQAFASPEQYSAPRYHPNSYTYADAINSYGGHLKYAFRYQASSRPVQAADIIIRGNGITLYHTLKQSYGPLRDNSIEVPFVENCAPGYIRRRSGPYLGECVQGVLPCNCNGHSNSCDQQTGRCLNCQHNTDGPSCEMCKRGFYGDARRGTPSDCQPCPCPMVDVPGQFSPTCVLEADGQVTCNSCPIGFEGRRCERCAPGYERYPPGSVDGSCHLKVKILQDRFFFRFKIEARFSSRLSGEASELSPLVTGASCDQCKANSFHLHPSSPLGCVECFCMGITKSCTSSFYHREQEVLRFSTSTEGVHLTTLDRATTIDRGLKLDPRSKELVYQDFASHPRQSYYWQLPQRFLGDKTSWIRADGLPATREHFLMVLADLSSILVKATLSEETDTASLVEASLDIAVEYPTGQALANAVEHCRCPIGYKGLSCEDCDAGYTRSGAGLYLGLCVPCFCNGHSSDCDPETGACSVSVQKTAFGITLCDQS
ncbi:hypothetical protein HPB51_009343 [Rhipicephalus microplus]|uniref:Uncharacterized protein n=1 Tax=Rhipicephalus microplus TaxID=6941 RepID=A0A9J6F0R6_RHIMP|nr:hypothetical protein HPB51_009343 [Rhipicephalus microplus]